LFDENSMSDVATIRSFNRAYTNRIGLLEARLDGSSFTLSEARVLYEIATRPAPTAAEVGRSLNMDRAQISRTLKRFARRELIEVEDDPNHGRQQLLSLTSSGEAAFAELNGKTEDRIGSFLERLPPGKRERLVSAARAMTDALEADTQTHSVILRGLRPGDLGLVTARQAIVYANEYGWDQSYEVLVSRILADFSERFDESREAAWIAEAGDRMVGSIFLMAGEEREVGKLRLLYVEPDARGLGVGKMLVAACIERARAVGYRRLELWTNSVLDAARHIYERAGFQLVREEAHHSFGHDLVGQTWSLEL
jgi:DNA-binding MarR family transcriptional regulator/GNAT superfamily N-acetyltransferase